MASSSQPSIIVHSTPPLEPLPASDVLSLYYIALCQLLSPGRWACTTADWGENAGDLPYITHLGHLIPREHVGSIPAFEDPDAGLSVKQRAEARCWWSYIEQKVTDLMHHSLYSLPPNYPATIGKAQLSTLSFPESQYIPQRLRGIMKPRLDHVGLWGLGGYHRGDVEDDERQRTEDAYVTAPGGTVAPRAWTGFGARRQFAEQRRKRGESELVSRIRDVFGPLERMLSKRPYFFGERPTTTDLWLFANLTLVLSPTLPNPLLPDLLKSHFPAVVAHHQRVLQVLFPGPESLAWSNIPHIPPVQSTATWSDYLPSSSWFRRPATGRPAEQASEKRKKSKAERQFERGRWLWYAAAIGGMVLYVFANGLVKIEFDKVDEGGGENTIVMEEEEMEEAPEEEVEEIVIEVEEPPGRAEDVEVSEAELKEMAEEVAEELEMSS